MATPTQKLRRVLSPVAGPAHRRLRRALLRWSRRAVILTYHRVARLPTYPFRTAVDPGRFDRQMAMLKRHYRPVGLRDFVAALGQGDVAPRSVVVTFDDGYADVLANAVPVLTRLGVPATVFVISGAVDSDKEQWWDRAERVASAACDRREPVVLEGGAGETRWDVGSDTEPAELLNRIHRSLLPLPDGKRHAVLDGLVEQLGLPTFPRPEHRFMNREELVETAAASGIEIGAHTVSHPLLAALPAEEQRQEIRQSRERLQELTGGSVPSFSYPYGGDGAYTGETVSAVDEAGFKSACTTYHQPVAAGTPLLELPRCSVHDWEPEELHRRLDAFFAIPVPAN